MMCKKSPLLVLFLVVSLCASLSFMHLLGEERDAVLCDQCGGALGAEYYEAADRSFCSEECFKHFFVCARCGKFSEEIESHANIVGEDIFFCPECAKKERCFFCDGFDNLERVEDDRILCETCRKEGVASEEDAAAILDEVRQSLFERFQFPKEHEIPLEITTFARISEATPHDDGLAPLATHVTQSPVNVHLGNDGKIVLTPLPIECKIQILSHSPRDLLMDSLAHELAHDFVRRRFFAIDDLKIEEGFAEFVAAQCNILWKREALNIRKDYNEHPIYGDGYRLFRDTYASEGWEGVLALLEEHSVSQEVFFMSKPPSEYVDSWTCFLLKLIGKTPTLKWEPNEKECH